jgi:deaminated glutathione amidase
MSTAVVALIQTDPGPDKPANLERTFALVEEAARAGADWVALPETFHCRGPREVKLAAAEPIDGPLARALSDAARRHGLWLFAGSFNEPSDDPNKTWNTGLVFDPDGERRAVYRKIHMFDVVVDGGVTMQESAHNRPGERLESVDTPLGPVGLTICYDLRFPELYRALALHGAVATMVPSNFTVPTGRDHWEVLLRARAIENGQYVVAAATIGDGGGKGGFRAYGRSLVVDPWGTVIACAPDEVGVTYARIDSDRVEKVRRQIPTLHHLRPDVYGRRAATSHSTMAGHRGEVSTGSFAVAG